MSIDIVNSISQAITKQENISSVQPTLNNPGGLMDVPFYRQTGKFRLASYNTPEEGQAALAQTVSAYVKQGITLEEMFAKYAPSGHGANDPATYATNVSSWTGIPLGVPLNQVGGEAITSPTTPTIYDGIASTVVDTNGQMNAQLSQADTSYVIGAIVLAAAGLWGVKELFS